MSGKDDKIKGVSIIECARKIVVPVSPYSFATPRNSRNN